MGNGAALKRQCSRPSSTLQKCRHPRQKQKAVRANPDGLGCDKDYARSRIGSSSGITISAGTLNSHNALQRRVGADLFT
jgi:hypothetical protein